MGQVHATEVDGVRAFWVDSGRPTLAATLMFRAGFADERLASAGWLHLLEHLALHGLPRGTLAVNGSVGPLYTSFSMHGPAEQVIASLETVTRRLASPELAELQRERRVLAAEAATRGGPVQRALGQRYGARGPGLAAYDDAALGRATPELLQETSRWAFCAGNGALALDGPPPSGMRLRLLSGGRPRAIEPTKPAESPRSVYAEPAGLVLSGVVPRSAANTLVPHVVEDALRRRLRDQDGTSYSPYSLYEAVDAQSAVLLAGADVSPTTAPSLLGTVLDLTDELARQGPDPDTLDDIKAALRQGYTDPYNVGFLSHRAAGESLWGRSFEQLDELLERHDAISPSDVQPALVELGETLIAGVPPESAPHSRLRDIQLPIMHVPAGGRRSSNWPADESRLAVTERMVTFGDRWSHHQFPLSELVGYYTWDNGARRLVLADGWGFTLVPGAWRGGDSDRERLDALVPDEMHLPQPPETAPELVGRASWGHRWWHALRQTLRSAGPVLVTVFAIVLALAIWRAGILATAVSRGAPDAGGHAVATLVAFGFLAWTTKLALEVRQDR